MLRYLLRRALWTLPVLVGATLLLFAVLSRLPRSPQTADLPILINPSPRDVRAISNEAMLAVAKNQDTAEAGPRLASLGGAALPFVVPQLDALSAEERGRVALALAPVARRMGLATPNAFRDGPSAVVFWTRFWEERSGDFKPSVVRRAVRRLAAHGSRSRRMELIELDTFALDELISAFGDVDGPDDVARVARLVDVASHVTERTDRILSNASLDEARRCKARWNEWWIDARVDHTALSGSDRVAATLVETRYGHWALQVLTLRLGVCRDGVGVLDKLTGGGPLTLILTIAALLFAYGLAIPLGVLGALRHKCALDWFTSACAIACFAVPCAAAALTLAYAAGWRYAVATACVAVALGLIASPSRQQRVATLDVLGSDSLRLARSKGLGLLRILIVHVVRCSLLPALTLIGLDFPLALSGACVVEKIFGLPGIGHAVIDAASHADLPFLMAFGIAAASVSGLALVCTEIASAWIDPRFRRALLREGG